MDSVLILTWSWSGANEILKVYANNPQTRKRAEEDVKTANKNRSIIHRLIGEQYILKEHEVKTYSIEGL